MANAVAIPQLDLEPLHRRLRDGIEAAVRTVLDSNAFVLGEHVQRFEENAAGYLGVRHAIGVGSGTDALLLALRAAGIGPGDEVVVPAFTFFGTVEAVLHAGARPVFADIDPRTMQLGPAQFERVITPRTRAVIPVHLFGRLAPVRQIGEIAAAHGIAVIEDAAQAFGARSADGCVGGIGLAAAFSFHPTKPLGALGDGGMVTTHDDDIARRVRELRDHGAAQRYVHTAVGYNSRLDSVQAAVLAVKLHDLDRHLAVRDALATRYRELLRNLPLDLPPPPGDQRLAHAQFTVQLDERDMVRARLAAAGIGTAVHYPAPVYAQPALRGHVPSGFALPGAESVCRRCLSLPLYEGLGDAQLQRVAQVLADAVS